MAPIKTFIPITNAPEENVGNLIIHHDDGKVETKPYQRLDNLLSHGVDLTVQTPKQEVVPESQVPKK